MKMAAVYECTSECIRAHLEHYPIEMQELHGMEMRPGHCRTRPETTPAISCKRHRDAICGRLAQDEAYGRRGALGVLCGTENALRGRVGVAPSPRRRRLTQCIFSTAEDTSSVLAKIAWIAKSAASMLNAGVHMPWISRSPANSPMTTIAMHCCV